MTSNKILLICLAFIALTACNAGSKRQTNHHMENEKRTLVKLETTMGNITVALYNETCLSDLNQIVPPFFHSIYICSHMNLGNSFYPLLCKSSMIYYFFYSISFKTSIYVVCPLLSPLF